MAMFKTRAQRITELHTIIRSTAQARGYVEKGDHVVIPQVQEEYLHGYLRGLLTREEFIISLSFICSCPQHWRAHGC
jgi:hypothetical protein